MTSLLEHARLTDYNHWLLACPHFARMPIAAPAPAPVLKYSRVKRGGGGGDIVSSYAPGPPSSTYHRGGHAPTIDGSEGGFVSLIIGLGILIIGSGVGVWLLLKRRKEKGRRPIPFYNNFIGGRSKDGAGGGSAFNPLSTNDRRGFVRTNDGDEDEWDDDTKGLGGGGMKLTEPRSGSPLPAKGEREGLYSNDSNPFGTPSTTHFQDRPGPYNKAFTTRPSTDSLDEAVHASYRAVSPQEGDHEQEREARHGSQESPETSPTFEGGTKFKEGF